MHAPPENFENYSPGEVHCQLFTTIILFKVIMSYFLIVLGRLFHRDKIKSFTGGGGMRFVEVGQGRRNTFEIGGAEFLEAPPWLAPSGKFFEN